MSFEKSKVSFRVILTGAYRIGEDFETALAGMGYAQTPPVDEYSIVDVCRGRSLWGGSDMELPEGWLRYGSNLYFALRTREKQIDKKLLAEYVEHLIEKEVAETDNYPNGKRRKEIKEEAKMALMALGTEKLTGIRVLAPLNGRCVLVEGSPKNREKVESIVRMCAPDVEPMLFSPDFLYAVNTAKTGQPQDYVPYSVMGKNNDLGIGADFLTWLWMASETMGELPQDVMVSLCGDIVFKSAEDEPTSSVTIKLSKGVPWEGAEPRAAFEEGKKITSARFRFISDGRTYEVTLDDGFGLNTFDIIDGVEEGLDLQSTLNERASAITDFLRMLTGLFYKFMAEGEASGDKVNDWIKDRWGLGSDDSSFTVVDTKGEVIGEVDLTGQLSSTTNLGELVAWLETECPEVVAAMDGLEQPALIIDREPHVITVVEMAANAGD